MSGRIAILLGAVTLLAAPARADLLADAMASDAAVEEQVRGLLVQALLGDAAATEAQVLALDDLDAQRAQAGLVRTGLGDDARYLAAGLWLTRDGRRQALEHVLDRHPDPVVRRLAEHRIEADDGSTADRLLADDRHNRRASLVNDAVRPLGIFSGAAFLAALNPFIMAGSAVDSAVTTAVNLWHYNRLSTPEREALARYQRQLEREPRTQDAPEIADAIRRLGAKRAAALCDDTLDRCTEALDDGDLDHAAFYVGEAADLDGCAERAEKPTKRLARARAERDAHEDAGRWPVDDPPRAASEDERRDHEAVVIAAALGDPGPLLDAAAKFRDRHAKSGLRPATELATALALDLSDRRPEARDALDALADDDDGSAGRLARSILDSPEFTRLDAIRSAEHRHTRETARFVLLGPPNGRTALYGAAQLGAEGVRAAESLGIFNVIGVATRAWQAWRRDPISNQEIIDRGEQFLAREPTSEHVPEVHGRLADAYERAEQYPRALMHYKLSQDPDADHVADLEGKVAAQLLADAEKRGNDPVLLAGIAEKFGSTDAGEKAKKVLDERGDGGELVLGRDVLLEHPDLLGPDALDLDPRLLDGERDNGELADGGVTLAPGELRLALRADKTSNERVETRTLDPQPYTRARAAAQEVLYTRLLTAEKNPDAGRFERYMPFFLNGTVDTGGGFYVYPGVKTRKYQSSDQKLYE
jgi:hypothetical protein